MLKQLASTKSHGQLSLSSFICYWNNYIGILTHMYVFSFYDNLQIICESISFYLFSRVLLVKEDMIISFECHPFYVLIANMAR